MASPAHDPAAILDSIGWSPDATPQRIEGGWDNHIWRFERHGQPFALRLARLDPTAASGSQAQALNNEANAIRIAAGAGLPVPEVVATGEAQGAPLMVQRWLPGATVLDAVKRAPWTARRMGRAFGRMQARMHTIPGDGLRSSLDTDWIDRADHPRLVAYIREAVANGPQRFCHFDYHPLNVLAEGSRITGVIDLANASSSDPRADLGLTNALLTAAPVPPGLTRKLVAVVRRRFMAGWREGYLDYAGQFPLEPAFEALGYALYLHEFSVAMRDGRGWADERDIARLRVLRDERIVAAGLG